MSKTYEARLKIEKIIQERKLDAAEVKGALSLRSGILLAFVRPESSDDPAKLEKLRAAVREILKIEI